MTTRISRPDRGPTRRARPWIAALALAALVAGCDGGSGQSGSAFVFLSVDGFSVAGQAVALVTASSSQTSFTSVCVTLRNNLKNPTVTAPTALDNVTVQSYTVTVRGVDGRVLVGPFTIGASVLVPAGTAAQGAVSGNTATFGIVLIPAGSKPGGAPLTANAEVVFKGRDARGSGVQAQGSIAIQVVKGGTDDSCSATASGGGTGTTTGTTTGLTTDTTGTTTGTTGTTTGITTGTSTST
jgi:hypothetical protein